MPPAIAAPWRQEAPSPPEEPLQNNGRHHEPGFEGQGPEEQPECPPQHPGEGAAGGAAGPQVCGGRYCGGAAVHGPAPQPRPLEPAAHRGGVLHQGQPRRGYFIRLFDVKEGKQVWEQELYNQMEYYSPRPFFHTFSADDCQVGLNFTCEQEAEAFRETVEEKIQQRANRQDNRGPPPPPPPHPNGPAPGNSGSPRTVDIPNPDIQASRYRSTSIPTPAPACISMAKNDKKKKKDKGRPKLTKADIGAPSGFKHITHVGWDPNSGFDTNNLDPDLKKLFSCAGISDDQLTDAETSKLIYEFIESSGGLEAVKEEMRKQGPPPGRPAAPPARGQSPRGPSSSSNRGLPPPPPAQPSYSSLMLSLAQLNPSQPTHYSQPLKRSGQDPNLMVHCVVGTLRVQSKRRNKGGSQTALSPTPEDESSEGIVGALMMVMQKRSKVIHSSEGEDDEGDDDEDDDWDD
ncbi:hypothetical protein ANANG_G00217550 [Anguilla anguilla]|uniref:Uncharacterized protein n=1 Tax=Anguilla anguilla TaxID=7936 RepID=A0A9D3LXY0_ANGAN|nr:hypothetical protein ANANG_G00217550 [Anguilla anguilla]